MKRKILPLVLSVFVVGCNMDNGDADVNENVVDDVVSLFSKKYEEPSYVIERDDSSTEGLIEEVGGLTGKNKISIDDNGTLLEFSISKTVGHHVYRYHCLFTVAPHCEYSDRLTLAEVLNGRNLTQYYIWRVNEATDEQQDMAVGGVRP